MGEAPISLRLASAWGPVQWPCLPGAEEMMESQTTPLAVYSFWSFCIFPPE